MSADLVEATMSPVPTFAEFLASCPPGKKQMVNYVVQQIAQQGTAFALVKLASVDIRIECPSDVCNGITFFECADVQGADLPLNTEHLYFVYLRYRCRNCRKHFKTIAIKFTSPQQGD